MPTYEYRCSSCGCEFEQFQSITAKPLKTCPNCKRRALQRLIGSGGAIIFKGSGFYQTDYRSDSYKKAAEAEKKNASADSGDKPAKDSGTKTTPKKNTSSSSTSETTKPM